VRAASCFILMLVAGWWSAGSLHSAPARALPSGIKTASGSVQVAIPAPIPNVNQRFGGMRLSIRFPNRIIIPRINIPFANVGMPERLSSRPGRAYAGRPGAQFLPSPSRPTTPNGDSNAITATAKVYIVETPNAYAYHSSPLCRQINKPGIPESRELTQKEAEAPPLKRTPCEICYGEGR